jgi:hypothetical protein
MSQPSLVSPEAAAGEPGQVAVRDLPLRVFHWALALLSLAPAGAFQLLV